MRRAWIGNKEPNDDPDCDETAPTVTVHNEMAPKNGKSLAETLTTISVIVGLLTSLIGFLIAQNQRISAQEYTTQSRAPAIDDIKLLRQKWKLSNIRIKFPFRTAPRCATSRSEKKRRSAIRTQIWRGSGQNSTKCWRF